MAGCNVSVKAAYGRGANVEEAVPFRSVSSDLLNMDGEDENETQTYVNFTTVSKTRFCYRLDILERCVRNKKVPKEMVDVVSWLKSKVSNSESARAALKEFVSIVDDKHIWVDFEVLVKLSAPMRKYLRRFDKDSVDMTTIHPETKKLERKYEDLIGDLQPSSDSSCTPGEAGKILASLKKRVSMVPPTAL